MVDWSFKLQLISPWFCAFKIVSLNSLQNYLKYTKLAKCCCTRCIIILYVPLWQIVASLALRPCNRHKQREVVFALLTVHHYPLVEWESIKSYYITLAESDSIEICRERNELIRRWQIQNAVNVPNLCKLRPDLDSAYRGYTSTHAIWFRRSTIMGLIYIHNLTTSFSANHKYMSGVYAHR